MDHDIILADEDVMWNAESMTVTTVATMRQEQSLQDDIDEGLLLPLSELIRSRQTVDDGTERAKMFSGRGYHPDAEIRDRHGDEEEAISYGTGVSHDASTVNSEMTFSFNDNRKQKYAANKLELAQSKATIADKDRKIAELMRQMEMMKAGKTGQSVYGDDFESSHSRGGDSADDDEQQLYEYEDDDVSASNADVSSNTTDRRQQSQDEESSSEDDDSDSDSDSSDGSSSYESVTHLSTSNQRYDTRENFDVEEYDRASKLHRDQDPPSDVASDDGSESRDY